MWSASLAASCTATAAEIVAPPEASTAERAESLERISEFEDKKKYYEELVVNLEKRIYGDTDTDVDKRDNKFIMYRIIVICVLTLFEKLDIVL